MSIARRFTSLDTERKTSGSTGAVRETSVDPITQPKNRGGRPKSPISEATLKPWVKAGVSRNTWYARKREKRLFEEGRKAGLAEKE